MVKCSEYNSGYHTTKMQKEIIIDKLKERGCRITKQRLAIIDIVLESKCSCCKEIFFKVSKTDDKISMATVYRVMNMLEEIEAIRKNNIYQIELKQKIKGCMIILNDNTKYNLSKENFNDVVKAGMIKLGYINSNKNVESITIDE